jgi:hypothetical protein
VFRWCRTPEKISFPPLVGAVSFWVKLQVHHQHSDLHCDLPMLLNQISSVRIWLSLKGMDFFRRKVTAAKHASEFFYRHFVSQGLPLVLRLLFSWHTSKTDSLSRRCLFKVFSRIQVPVCKFFLWAKAWRARKYFWSKLSNSNSWIRSIAYSLVDCRTSRRPVFFFRPVSLAEKGSVCFSGVETSVCPKRKHL